MEAVMHLNTLVSHMFAKDLLDNQFLQLHVIKASSTPDFVAKVVTLFSKDSEQIIGELAKLLYMPYVDFEKVDGFVYRLKGSSSSIGAKRVKNTCIQFRLFCQEKNKHGCLKTLNAVRSDFYDLRSKFQTMIQLEQQIQAFYAKL